MNQRICHCDVFDVEVDVNERTVIVKAFSDLPAGINVFVDIGRSYQLRSGASRSWVWDEGTYTIESNGDRNLVYQNSLQIDICDENACQFFEAEREAMVGHISNEVEFQFCVARQRLCRGFSGRQVVDDGGLRIVEAIARRELPVNSEILERISAMANEIPTAISHSNNTQQLILKAVSGMEVGRVSIAKSALQSAQQAARAIGDHLSLVEAKCMLADIRISEGDVDSFRKLAVECRELISSYLDGRVEDDLWQPFLEQITQLEQETRKGDQVAERETS